MEQPKKKGSIRIYHSFEEANEADDREAAALTPQQHLANAFRLIKVFAGYKGGRSSVRKITHIGYGFRPH